MKIKQPGWMIGAALVVALVLLLFTPTPHQQVVNQGTDTYSAHLPVFGNRSVTREINVPENLIGLGFILVDLRKSGALPEVTITVLDQKDSVITNQSIPIQKIQDDMFVWAKLKSPLKDSGGVKVRIEAPNGTTQNAVGVRIDKDSKDLALAIKQQVPAWQQVPLWIQDHPSAAQRLSKTLITSVIVGLVLWIMELVSRKYKYAFVAGLLLLVVATVIIRWPLLTQIESAFGGDAFNFFFKSSAWVQGLDPFATDARKAPLYAFALIPGLSMPDPLLWGRLLNLASAAAVVIFITLIAVEFALPTSLALGAGALIAVNRHMWFESAHNLANMPYTTLIAACVFFFIRGVKSKKGYMLGLLSGLTFLTRYEGALVGAILLPAYWITTQGNWRKIGRSLLPCLILVAIPFLLWPLTGELGIRSLGDIQGDEGLGLAHSVDDFVANLKLYRLYIGRMWVLAPAVGNQATIAVVGFLIGGTIAFVNKRLKAGITPGISAALIAAIVFLLIRSNNDVLKHISLIYSLCTGLGAGYLSWRWPKLSLPILAVVLTQSFIITLILPKDRYYLQIIPILGLAVAAGVSALSSQGAGWKKAIPITLIALLIGITYADAREVIPGQISQYNEQSRETTAILKAARYLRAHPGLTAMASDYLPIRIYVGDQAFKNPPSQQTPAEQLKWLQEQGVTRVMEVTSQPIFKDTIHTYPEHFQMEATFAPKADDMQAIIYQFTP